MQLEIKKLKHNDVSNEERQGFEMMFLRSWATVQDNYIESLAFNSAILGVDLGTLKAGTKLAYISFNFEKRTIVLCVLEDDLIDFDKYETYGFDLKQ